MLLQKQMSKSDIKKMYLLTNKQIDVLPFKIKEIIKYGKQHIGYAYLYDEDEVIKLAIQIHGSLENIQKKLLAKEKRKKIKL